MEFSGVTPTDTQGGEWLRGVWDASWALSRRDESGFVACVLGLLEAEPNVTQGVTRHVHDNLSR